MEFINETRCNERTVLAMNRASIRATHWWSSLLLRLLGGACGVFLLRTAARLGFPSLGGISAGLMGGGLLLWVLFLNHIRAWIVIRLVLKGEQLHRAAFDEEGCTIRSGGDEVRLSYDQVAAFYEDQRYFFLMLTGTRDMPWRSRGSAPASRTPSGPFWSARRIAGPSGSEKMTSGWRELALPAARR